jgi:hypothetical protein
VFLFVAGGPWAAHAARISEPDTVLYGRVIEHVGPREFLFTSGRLSWNLRTTGPMGRNFQLTAQLESLGGGHYSYRLSIPHEVLAYDLTVRSNAIGLASSSTQVEHLSVTVDGQPLTINPAAVDGFTVAQSQRANALRIDLVLTTNSPDSDGDGLPDWWEDQNGLNKYDHTDAAKVFPTPVPALATSDPTAAAQAQTLAAWRNAWFPGNTDDLDLFGLQDPDNDGIPNLFEYAFNLNPTAPDANSFEALPHAISISGRPGIAFQRRANATDLRYQIESATDLFNWQDTSNEVEQVLPLAGAAPGTSVFLMRPDNSASYQFLRVRVNRQ